MHNVINQLNDKKMKRQWYKRKQIRLSHTSKRMFEIFDLSKVLTS
jgi:hypothetical protein